MVNPYYFFFYLFYKLFYPIAKEKDRLPFGISSIMGLILMIHGFVTLIIVEKTYNISKIIPKMNKFLFGIILFMLFFLLNHFLFERNDRYLKVTNEIAASKQFKRIIAALIVIVYLSIPIIVKWLFLSQ